MISATHFWIDEEEYSKIVYQFSGVNKRYDMFRFSFEEYNYTLLFNKECGIKLGAQIDHRIKLQIMDQKKFFWAKIKYGI